MRHLYLIDNSIDLFKVCADASWHLASSIEALQTAGLPRADAEAYAYFAFGTYALDNRGKTDCDPNDHLDEMQQIRLSVELRD